jgi:nucleotide-binding universal stress UspA family protein
MAPYRRIIHATDFSSSALPALRQAVALARRWRARVILLHVMTPPSPFVSEGLPPSSYDQLLAHARRETKRHLTALLSRVRRKGVQASAVLAEGFPAEEVLRIARRQRADLLVLGTHGRTGLRRALMGSVAERIVRQARCPVLTVRP